VSTAEQDPALQLDALKQAGCWRVFTDHASGSREDRPELVAALDSLRPGAVLGVSVARLLGQTAQAEADGVAMMAGWTRVWHGPSLPGWWVLPRVGPRRRRGLAGGGGAVYLDGVSTAHADPPSPTWAQAAADAAAQAAEGGEAVLVLPDGTAAVLMSKSRVVQLHDQLDGLGETRSVLGSRRSRTRLLRGLADVTAGRTHGAADAAAALARHPGRR